MKLGVIGFALLLWGPNITAKDLDSFFSLHPKLSILMTRDVSFGETLDKILDRLPDNNKRYLSHERFHQVKVKMLLHRRSDFILEYPSTLSDMSEFSEIGLVGNPIKGASSFVLGYFMCSNNEKSKAAMVVINQTLVRLYQSGELRQLHLSRLHRADRALFTSDFTQEFH